MQSDLIRLSFANASFKGKNLPYGDFSKVFFRFYICLHSLLFLLDSRGLLSMHDIINIWFLTFTIICAPNPDEGARSWPGNKYKKNKVDRTFEVANGLCTKRCTPKKMLLKWKRCIAAEFTRQCISCRTGWLPLFRTHSFPLSVVWAQFYFLVAGISHHL